MEAHSPPIAPHALVPFDLSSLNLFFAFLYSFYSSPSDFLSNFLIHTVLPPVTGPFRVGRSSLLSLPLSSRSQFHQAFSRKLPLTARSRAGSFAISSYTAYSLPSQEASSLQFVTVSIQCSVICTSLPSDCKLPEGRYHGCPACSRVSGTSWNVWHFVGIQS